MCLERSQLTHNCWARIWLFVTDQLSRLFTTNTNNPQLTTQNMSAHWFQSHNELFTDHHTISMSEYVGQGAAEKETDCPSHPGSMITIACLLCLQLLCPDCLEAMGGCSQGEIRVNETVLMQWIWDIEAKTIDPPGGAHKLAAVKSACEEAKRRLQSNKDNLKRRQRELGDEMKKYKKLLRQLETEYNNTMEDMRRHMEEQVGETCLSFYCIVFAATIAWYASVPI